MAVDQAILEQTTDQPTLRIYGWDSPTLSLGYFQNYADRDSHSASVKAPCVRRASGGGAIMHDREITYSLCMPSQNRWAREHAELYDRVHRAIIRVLQKYDVAATLHGDVQPQTAPSENAPSDSEARPFLCFLRRTSGDVVAGRDKIVGSAQRRGRQALLQHGSILMRRSELAPELPGINDLAPRPVEYAGFVIDWLSELADELDLQLEPGSLSPPEFEAARKIETERFGNEAWTRKR